MTPPFDAPVEPSLVIHRYAEDKMLAYAMKTVRDRALAQVQEGQKPVQKRILFGMYKLGLLTSPSFVKSARVVGEVMGKYHPHGDSSIYGALVRMAQDFKLRYPLITGQGNFGSRDGDEAAAMRYSECKLAPIAELLLSELPKDAVDFIPNYDGKEMEPTLLPARLPFLLLNGSMGIAVGMASNIPPHNLREVANGVVAMLENPNLTLSELMQHIPGPDFPDGAQIISNSIDTESAYQSGKGSTRLRAVWKKEELTRGQWQLVITQFPYEGSAAKSLIELDELTNPQAALGKKTITQQQANLKQLALTLLEGARDESDKSDPVRLVISPKTSKVDIDELTGFLWANTSLEVSVPINMTLLGLDANPTRKGLLAILQEWVQFRRSTVRRRTQFELNQILARIHILEGRLKVLISIEKVIQLIRGSDEPKPVLVSTFGVSDIQADDILDMKLRQLSKLEGFSLDKELAEKRPEAIRLQGLLDSEKLMTQLIVKEVQADAAKYGDGRRTLIKEEARAVAGEITRTVADEDATVILSKNLWIRARGGHDVDPASITYRAGDEGFAVLKTRTTWPVFFLDSNGRVYSIQTSELPTARGDGVPLTSLIEVQDGARILFAFSGNPESRYLFAGQQGYGLTAPLKNLVARPRAGKAFLTLDKGETPMRPLSVPDVPDGFVACGSSDGRLLMFPLTEVKSLDKGGKGVMLMVVGDGNKMTGLGLMPTDQFAGTLTLAAKTWDVNLTGESIQKHIGRRARKGSQLPKKGVWTSV